MLGVREGREDQTEDREGGDQPAQLRAELVRHRGDDEHETGGDQHARRKVPARWLERDGARHALGHDAQDAADGQQQKCERRPDGPVPEVEERGRQQEREARAQGAERPAEARRAAAVGEAEQADRYLAKQAADGRLCRERGPLLDGQEE